MKLDFLKKHCGKSHLFCFYSLDYFIFLNCFTVLLWSKKLQETRFSKKEW